MNRWLKDISIPIYLMAGCVFFLPSLVRIAVVFLIAFVTLSIILDFKKRSIHQLRKYYFILPLVYFLLHVIGLLYSDNMNYGGKDIEMKLSFFVLPIAFSFLIITRKELTFIKSAFIGGCFVASVICLVNACLKFGNDRSALHFFYMTFSIFMHPTYFSFYLNFCILLLLDNYFNFSKRSKVNLALIFFFGIIIMLLNARMGIIVAYITIPALILANRQRMVNLKSTILLASSSVLLLASLQLITAHFYNRFKQIENTITNPAQVNAELHGEKLPPEQYNSTTSRIALWRNVSEVIMEHPLFGVGTGDIKEVLVEKYRSTGFEKGASEKYNPHNQFMHTTVILGIFGLTILILLLFYSLWKAVKGKNMILVFFLVIIIMNGLTESVLEVQSGILFFMIFFMLLNLQVEEQDRLPV